MIKLSIDEIRTIIKPVGLSPTKSKGIWNLSKILIDKYDGIVPEDISKLEELPSVGHKTASVVVSQAFGQPAFPVDTHIHRLMYRWGLSSGKDYFLNLNGMDFILELFFMEESFVQLVDGILIMTL
jgi:endonuclease-3